MLIKSDRHTKADLELWKENLDIDKIRSKQAGFYRKILQCERIIEEFVQQDKKYFVAISWGKDSVVLADLFYKAKANCKYIYVRNLDREIPESLIVRDIYLKTHNINYEEIGYSYSEAKPSWFDKFGNPIKWYSILNDLQKEYGCHVTGIRYDESAKRKHRFIFMGVETEYSFAPFRYIDCHDIFAYLYLHDLPVHPNYAMTGGGRWDKYRIRVAAIGNKEGNGMGRTEWEREYYADILNRLQSKN